MNIENFQLLAKGNYYYPIRVYVPKINNSKSSEQSSDTTNTVLEARTISSKESLEEQYFLLYTFLILICVYLIILAFIFHKKIKI